MTLTVTKGMDGRKVESIGTYTAKQIDKMHKDFYGWKCANKAKDKYHIASYERRIYKDDKHRIIIDFGDYTYFGLVKANKKEWEALEAHSTKPIDLDV